MIEEESTTNWEDAEGMVLPAISVKDYEGGGSFVYCTADEGFTEVTVAAAGSALDVTRILGMVMENLAIKSTIPVHELAMQSLEVAHRIQREREEG